MSKNSIIMSLGPLRSRRGSKAKAKASKSCAYAVVASGKKSTCHRKLAGARRAAVALARKSSSHSSRILGHGSTWSCRAKKGAAVVCKSNRR